MNKQRFEYVPRFCFAEVPERVEALTDADRRLFDACSKHSPVLVKEAIASGANVNARDAQNDYTTPLLVAIERSCYDVLDHKPSETEMACWRTDSLAIAKLLIEAGSDPNAGVVSVAPDNSFEECMTPLMQAAWLHKDVELSRYLLENGANPNVYSDTQCKETVRDLNDMDYNVDSPIEVKPIECLLNDYGGCCYYIFNPEAYKDLTEIDRDLVYACQRLDRSAARSSVEGGANVSMKVWGKLCLPVVAMNDAPQLLGLYFRQNGKDVEDEILRFVMLLLDELAMPVGEDEADNMINACVENGYERMLLALTRHAKYGEMFVSRGRQLKIGGWPWECWPQDKQERMALAFGEMNAI